MLHNRFHSLWWNHTASKCVCRHLADTFPLRRAHTYFFPQEVVRHLSRTADSHTQLPFRSTCCIFRLDTFCNHPSCRGFHVCQQDLHYTFLLDNLYTQHILLGLQGIFQLGKLSTRCYLFRSCSGHLGKWYNLQHWLLMNTFQFRKAGIAYHASKFRFEIFHYLKDSFATR